jgi:Kef-type K+ transport system membrane component KefB
MPRSEVARRAVVSVGLLGVALIHLLDLPRKFNETPYLAVGNVVVIMFTILIAESLLYRVDRRTWRATALLGAALLFTYSVSRLIGLPGETHDVGNWLDPLGLAAIFVEGTVALLALGALARHER